MPQTQTFNDGYLRVFRIENTAQPGDAPRPEPVQKYGLRYAERSVGVTRMYQAMQAGQQIDLLLRCPRLPLSPLDIVIPNDGLQYRIESVQYPADVTPECMDLTLRRLDSIDSDGAD